MLRVAVFVVACLAPLTASAQYRNNAFGFYGGASFNVPNGNGAWFEQNTAFAATGLKAPDGNPFRLANPTFTAEFMGKISLEHFFLRTGFSLTILPDMVASTLTPKAVGGAVVALDASFGPRVYFATDQVRPFAEVGVRLALFNYTTAVADIMPAQWRVIPVVYGSAGIEFFVAPDIGISVLGRYNYYLIVNYPGLHMLDALAGMIFCL